MLHDVLGDRRDLVQTVSALGRRPGGLVGEQDSRDTSAVGLALPRLARHVIAAEHRAGRNVLEVGQVGREIEVEDVAAIVAVEVQDPGTTADRLGRLEALLGTRRAEDVSDRDAVAQSLAHITLEEREVPRSAAGDDPDLARDGGVGAHHDATVVAGSLQLIGVGQQDALDHLVDEVARLVEDLLHVFLRSVDGAGVDQDRRERGGSRRSSSPAAPGDLIGDHDQDQDHALRDRVLIGGSRSAVKPLATICSVRVANTTPSTVAKPPVGFVPPRTAITMTSST